MSLPRQATVKMIPEHEACGSGGVGDEFEFVAIASDQDGDDERSTGETQFHGHRHAWQRDAAL